jgi:hypothetical protein
MVIFTYANIFTNYKDFFPWATRSTYYASWSCSRNKSTGAGGGVRPVVPQDLQPELRS